MLSRLQPSLPIILLILVTAAIGHIYNYALPGFLLFDDLTNLRGLIEIADRESAINFVTSGNAGPFGRPIALATFAAQAAAWPDDPAALLRLNIAIHQAATGAAFMLAWALALIRSTGDDRATPWIALGVAATWGLSPFLATTHLMIIQRMTSLAGLFMLAGLAAFTWAHLIAPKRPRLARLLLLLGLGPGTLLATLCKENGTLLPLLALVILWLWIPKQWRLHTTTDRALVLLLGVIPSLALLGYLFLFSLPSIIENGYPQRYFSPAERMMVEPTILLEYLQNLLLPRESAVTPFMDRYPVPQGWLRPPIAFIAALFWPGLVASAIWLRHAVPYLLFGLAFFLVGHLLESSFIGLELYFAHRNYVPAFGVYFTLVYAAAMVPQSYRGLVAAGVTAYAFLFGLVLFQVANGWSQPRISAERWFVENSNSERAAQFLANQYLQEGNILTAQRIIDDVAEREPRVPVIQIQRTQFCGAGGAESAKRLATSVERLRHAYFEPVATTELLRSTQTNPAALCPGRGYSALAALADALLDNPPYARSTATKAELLATKGLVAVREENPGQAIALLTESFRLKPDLDTAFFAGSAMSHAGKLDELRPFLAEVRQAAPTDPLKQRIWHKRLDEFIQVVGVGESEGGDSTQVR